VDELRKENCQQVRELLSTALEAEGQSLAGLNVEGEPVEKHMEMCAPCQKWKAHTEDIVDVARSMPQFDVAEHLTQNILSTVASEQQSKQRQLSWIVYAAAMISFLYVMVIIDGSESVWGMGSWLVGLLTMLGLKMLVSDPAKERQTA